jgi:prepilin peptidase CpaA
VAADWQGLSNLWVIFAVAAASVTDLRWGKIYNVVTIPTVMAGLTLNGLASGWPGVALSLQGLGVGLALLLLTLLLGQHLGGGDIKLVAALGALRGPAFLATVLVVALPLGGAIALGLALARGRLGESLRRLGWLLYGRLVFGIAEPASPAPSLKFPYALAIAGGALAALWWRP